jgi:hypothetical protein
MFSDYNKKLVNGLMVRIPLQKSKVVNGRRITYTEFKEITYTPAEARVRRAYLAGNAVKEEMFVSILREPRAQYRDSLFY